MKKNIVIASMPVNDQPAIATVLYENDKATELYIQYLEKQELLGGIYVGQIERIQENINAAYVRIGKDLTAYLALDEGRCVDDFIMKTRREEKAELRGGDELLVQVEKEALKTKLPRVTGNLSFPGKYIVLTTRMKRLSFSRKLAPEEKIRLRKVFTKKMWKEFGIIVRTNAAEATEEELLAEYLKLAKEARELCAKGPTRTVYSQLKAPEQDWMRVIRQCAAEDLERIQTDVPEVFEYIRANTEAMGITNAVIVQKSTVKKHVIQLQNPEKKKEQGFPAQQGKNKPEEDNLSTADNATKAFSIINTGNAGDAEDKEKLADVCHETKVELYDDDLVALYQIKNLKTTLGRSLAKQVELKSGGNLVIEETEAFVVIDINSGKYESHKNSLEARKKINFEAAEMIARQMRLRQLSGTILIDFINMADAKDEKELLNFMEKLVRADSLKTTVIDITPLGIMEITREKKRKPLREQVFVQNNI